MIKSNQTLALYPSLAILSIRHEFSILPIKICDTSYKDFERGKAKKITRRVSLHTGYCCHLPHCSVLKFFQLLKEDKC